MKLAVLFLEYDNGKYSNAFARFKGYTEKLRKCDIRYYIIDNNKEGEGSARISDTLYRMDGDNSAWEFSGWRKGLTYLQRRHIDYDAVLLANNAFFAYGWSLLEFADKINLPAWLLQGHSVMGHIDTKDIYLEVFGYDVSRWICTNSFFLSRRAIEEIGDIVSLNNTDMDDIISPQFPGALEKKDCVRYFKETSPLNDNYKQMVITWLTEEWHGKFEIREATWVFFRNKVRSLLNESLLTAKIIKSGYSIESYKNYMGRRQLFFTAISKKIKSGGKPMNSNQDKKTRFWNFLTSKEAMAKRQQTDFSGLSLTHEFHNYLVTGRRDYHYLDYFRDRYLPQAKPVIASLGCGNGHLERLLAEKFLPDYAEIHGFDINPHLIEFAHQEAKKQGLKNLRYSVLDLDRPSLKPSYYDLIIFFHSLHHVERLEEALREVKKALKDSGLLLIVDFIGPTRFQWSDKQISIVQDLLDTMPDKYKRDLSGSGSTHKTKITRPDADAIAQGDPSEAIRSGEIMPIVGREFSIVEKKFMGGTLLSILLHNIAGNFDERNESDRTVILLIQKIEEITLRESILDPNYIFLVARKEASDEKI